MSVISDITYRMYGGAHRFGKRLLPGGVVQGRPDLLFVYDLAAHDSAFMPVRPEGGRSISLNGAVIDESSRVGQRDLFLGENACEGLRYRTRNHLQFEPHSSEAASLWEEMIENTRVPEGWRNEGLHLVGHVRSSGEWCLSSWIWTSAAIARYYLRIGRVDEVVRIADAFMCRQLDFGGWVVRFDYYGRRAVPIIAPNDSAYIACNALLTAFDAVGDPRYLRAAESCADWIVRTARSDGLVHFGQDGTTGLWIADRNIVDIGFTAELFCDLYSRGCGERHLEFADRFIRAYLDVFFDSKYGAFATSTDRRGVTAGGHFSRGQAWALEGLLAFYRITRDARVGEVIKSVADCLVKKQNVSGAWPYNLSRPLMGEDCKGTPVLAWSLLECHDVFRRQAWLDAAESALRWCERHTMRGVGCPGGIFSYSVEGAVAHTMYSETALTYATSHALEAKLLLGRVFG